MSGLEQCYLLLFNELGFSFYCVNKTKYKYVLSVDADKRLQLSYKTMIITLAFKLSVYQKSLIYFL